MTKETLYLFPDTNLFIQCKSLNELDWSEWANFSEIHLIVCRPVLREIDNQKNRGNGRVSRRARKAHSLFRDIAINEKDYELIQKDGPKVKLFLEPLIGPCSELSDRLDYSKPDDEIVGCLFTYVKQHPEADVRLLTYDSGPMMTAKSLDLSFVPVKEDWILPPENNEANREITRLKNEIAQLKKAEPEFHIKCLDSNDIEVDSLKIEYPVYEPLSEKDISAFMDLLKNRFPPAKIFGPREPEIGVLPEPLRLWNEAISRYKDQEYPFWIKKCEDFLSKLHEKRPSFFFLTGNRGTRPGNNKISGALECVIHAENLSNPVRKVVPVNITVKKRDSRDCADALVNDLLCSAK